MFFAISTQQGIGNLGGFISSECIDDGFLLQVTEEAMRQGVRLELILIDKEVLPGDVKIKCRLGCRGSELVFMISRGGRRVKIVLRILNFREQTVVFSKFCLEKSYGIRS